jgi:hypothetical protein
MFETIYSCLLRLFPSAFRRQYQEESLGLLRDRLRDERSFLRRLRLVADLLVDTAGALPQSYRNSYANVTTAGSIAPQLDQGPSFRTLNQEPIRREVVFIASVCAMTGLAMFAFVMGRPALYHAATNGHRSPIESVIERLNQATNPSAADQGYANAPIASVAGSTPAAAASPALAQPGPLAEVATSSSNTLAAVPIPVNLSGRWSLLRTDGGDTDLPRWFTFAQDSTRLTGTAGTNATGQYSILNGYVDGGSVSFELQNKQSTFRYDLRLEGKALRGTLSIRDAEGTRSTNVWLRASSR